jgi:hypothetical protein
MHRQLANPLVITGLLLMAFSVFLLMEAFGCIIIVEGVLGVLVGAAGWFLRRKGATSPKSLARTWRRCLVLGLPGLLVLYALGYMLLMDRSRPTRPTSEFYHYFESSLRMVPDEKEKGLRVPSGYPEVTILNLVFRPADKIYFQLFPRSDVEIESLKQLGYYR